VKKKLKMKPDGLLWLLFLPAKLPIEAAATPKRAWDKVVVVQESFDAK
jgi:hypothetical protein